MIPNSDTIANSTISTQKWLAAHQLQMNNVDPAVLFDRYERGGFLYPKKRQLLDAFMPEITANWRKAIQAGDKILWYVTHEAPDGAWATMCVWKSTHTGWVVQHLVSQSPSASRHVLLSCQSREIQQSESNAYQNWFQPSNRSARALHGTIETNVGVEFASVRSYDYFSLPQKCTPGEIKCGINIRLCGRDEQSVLCSLAEQERGSVYVKAEELDHPDFELHAVDELYKSVGLRRYRRIWLAWLPGASTPCAAAIAYCGPLGFNFSFLENRIDLIFAPVWNDEKLQVSRCLLSAASEVYCGHPPRHLLVTTVDTHREVMERLGGTLPRTYCQSICLRPGFPDWYQHVEKTYQRIMELIQRQAINQT